MEKYWLPKAKKELADVARCLEPSIKLVPGEELSFTDSCFPLLSFISKLSPYGLELFDNFTRKFVI